MADHHTDKLTTCCKVSHIQSTVYMSKSMEWGKLHYIKNKTICSIWSFYHGWKSYGSIPSDFYHLLFSFWQDSYKNLVSESAACTFKPLRLNSNIMYNLESSVLKIHISINRTKMEWILIAYFIDFVDFLNWNEQHFISSTNEDNNIYMTYIFVYTRGYKTIYRHCGYIINGGKVHYTLFLLNLLSFAQIKILKHKSNLLTDEVNLRLK